MASNTYSVTNNKVMIYLLNNLVKKLFLRGEYKQTVAPVCLSERWKWIKVTTSKQQNKQHLTFLYCQTIINLVCICLTQSSQISKLHHIPIWYIVYYILYIIILTKNTNKK